MRSRKFSRSSTKARISPGFFSLRLIFAACGLLAKQFLATESLQMKQAEAYVKSPREGKGLSVWGKAWFESEQPANKKRRTEDPTPSSSATWSAGKILERFSFGTEQEISKLIMLCSNNLYL